MIRRNLFLSLAAGFVALGLGGVDVRAGQIALPSALDQFVPPPNANYAIVGNLKFYDFAYTPTGTTTPTASNITLSAFTTIPGEIGITFNGGFFAPANTIVDYALSYKVTTIDGSLITDAYLSGVMGNFGGTGSVSIAESYFDASNGFDLLDLEISRPGVTVDTGLFAYGVSTVFVQKDVILSGGTLGSTVSFINQGFSTSIPEPGSMALLGIGLSGLLSFRRYFKRASLA